MLVVNNHQLPIVGCRQPIKISTKYGQPIIQNPHPEFLSNFQKQ